MQTYLKKNLIKDACAEYKIDDLFPDWDDSYEEKEISIEFE